MQTYAFFNFEDTLILPGATEEFLHFWQQRFLISQPDISAPVSALKSQIFEGSSSAEIEEAAAEWFMDALEESDLFRQETLDHLLELRQHGIEPVLISAGISALLRPAADYLGIRYILCSELEYDSDLATGRWKHFADGQERLRLTEGFLQEKGSELSESYVFAGSMDDIALLRTAAFPTVVDPCTELSGIARQQGWPALICVENMEIKSGALG